MLNPQVVARGLLKARNYFAHHTISSPGMAHPFEAVFEESYEVRAACRSFDLLFDGNQRKIARAFVKRMIRWQGIHVPNMYDMGYGYDLDEHGVVNCSCVADNACTATALLEAVRFFPDLPERDDTLASVKRYLDTCLAEYTSETGVMGVGVLNHRVNPEDMREYWCANALFVSALVSYAELAHAPSYYEPAVPMVEFIATFDYTNTLWKEWQQAAPQQILFYTSEGLVKALSSAELMSRLDVPPAGVIRKAAVASPESDAAGQAANRRRLELGSHVELDGRTIGSRLANRLGAFCEWLFDNQLAEGCFHHPRDPHYRCYEPGLAWILLDAASDVKGFAWTREIAVRQLRFLSTDAGKLYHGLYANDFATALSHLSFATAARYLAAHEPERWQAACDEVLERGEDMW